LIGPILQAAAGLAGNLFTNQQNLKLAKSSVQMRVADAKKAGIHPLAALGAQIQAPQVQPLVGDSVGNALGQIGASLTGTQAEDRALAIRRSEAEIRRVEAETAILRARSRTVIESGRRVGRERAAVEREVIPYGPFGRIHTNPTHADAQVIQDRYGDIVENVAGMGNVFADADHTLRRRVRVRALHARGQIARGRLPRNYTWGSDVPGLRFRPYRR